MVRITTDIFSGRPNPTYLAEADEATELLTQISQNKSAISGLHEGFQDLGYRGLIVEVLSDTAAVKLDLPSAFRIAGVAHPKGQEIAERIFSSMKKTQVLDDKLHTMLTEQLRQLSARTPALSAVETSEGDAGGGPSGAPPTAIVPPAGTAPAAAMQAPGAVCFIELGKFNPGFWNDPAHISHNNCYNYASNRRTDTFAQPGRGSGHVWSALTCPAVTTAALSDGLHHRYTCFPDSQKPRWLMALVMAPGMDYHWYRKQQEGFWGHKPGGTAARNYDNNGHVVWNPETAARGIYTQFCGYFYACKAQKIN
ncbi:MAG: hypothetical protein M3O35_19630 [Acidobacteriota bacterium]|nr:hypothetical protein [Acidobacteriota bacterium]